MSSFRLQKESAETKYEVSYGCRRGLRSAEQKARFSRWRLFLFLLRMLCSTWEHVEPWKRRPKCNQEEDKKPVNQESQRKPLKSSWIFRTRQKLFLDLCRDPLNGLPFFHNKKTVSGFRVVYLLIGQNTSSPPPINCPPTLVQKRGWPSQITFLVHRRHGFPRRLEPQCNCISLTDASFRNFWSSSFRAILTDHRAWQCLNVCTNFGKHHFSETCYKF